MNDRLEFIRIVDMALEDAFDADRKPENIRLHPDQRIRLVAEHAVIHQGDEMFIRGVRLVGDPSIAIGEFILG